MNNRAFFLGLLLLVHMAHADEISLRTDGWCPYSCSPTAEKRGILVEAVEQIFSEAGHSLDYDLLNWARAVKEVRSGHYDGLIDAYKSDAPDFVFPDEPFLESKMCFFVRQGDSWLYQGLPSLDGRKVSVVNNYSYGPLLDAYIEKPPLSGGAVFLWISGVELIERRLQQVLRGRVDTVLEDLKVFPYQVDRYKADNPDYQIASFKNAGCLPGENLYVAFSPGRAKSQYYADVISNGLKRMKRSGALDAIIRSYPAMGE